METVNKKRIFFIIILGLLVIGNVYFGLNYFYTNSDLQVLKGNEAKSVLNEKVLNFTGMFVNKVLQANTSVDFDTRLSLENAVRDLNDPEIMTEWESFTASKTQADAQNSVKKLLGLLVSKIQK